MEEMDTESLIYMIKRDKQIVLHLKMPLVELKNQNSEFETSLRQM